MNLTTSKILRKLNESYNNDDVIETESTVGIDDMPVVRQCVCGRFYKGEKCPTCGSAEGTIYKAVNESVDDPQKGEGESVENQPEVNPNPKSEDGPEDPKKEVTPVTESTDEEKKSVTVKPEDSIMVSEGIKLLNNSNYKEFNESFGSMTSIKNGKLVFAFESYNIARKLTSHQRAIYNMSERLNTTQSNDKSKKNESIKISRAELMIKNESRAIKNAVARILERQNAKFNYKKFNESMNELLSKRSAGYRSMLEDIQEDDQIGKEELADMDATEVAETVANVIEDTGLKVLDKSADNAGDESVVVSLRVEDSPEAEVSVNEIKKVLGDVFNAPIDVEGPNLSESDDMVADLEVIINPEKSVEESEDEEEEKTTLYDDDKSLGDPGEGPDIDDDDDDDDDDDEKKNESIKKSSRVYILAESASFRSGRVRYLKEDESGSTDDDAEDIKTFDTKDDAEDYLEENELEDEYVPVPVDVDDEEKKEECNKM